MTAFCQKAMPTLAIVAAVMLNAAPARGASNNVLAAGGDWVFDTSISGVAYRVHVFTNAATSPFTVNATGDVDYLVVAGGGSGGSRNAGGGGAGGVILRDGDAITNGVYAVAVGAGAPRDTAGQGGNGSNSSFFGSIAIGGGGGGRQGAATFQGLDGGSGGGRGVQSGQSPPNAGIGQQTNQPGKSYGFGHDGFHTSSSIGSGGGGAGGTGSGAAGGPGLYVSNYFTTAIGENGYVGGGGGGDGGAGGVGGGGDSVARLGPEAGLPNTGGGGGGGLEGSGVEFGGAGGSGVVAIRYTCLPAEQFTIADPNTGSTRFTNSNEVDLVAFPVPDGYDAYQITEDGGWSALGSWTSTSSVPGTLSFTQPGSDAVVTLYAWFTNLTADVPVRHTSQQIRYTTVAPTVSAHDMLYRASTGFQVAMTGEELDDGSTGGVFGDRPIGIHDVQAVWSSGPYADATPGDPFVTMTPYGSYGVSLVVMNEAGNVATASVPTTVELVRNLTTADGGDLVFDGRVSNVLYRFHVFTNLTTSTLTVHTRGAIDYLIVAGGGGGGGRDGGGGGAGGVILGRYEVITQGVYNVTVGGGSIGGSGHSSHGSVGTNSSFYGAIALGGGGGGARGSGYYGLNGGSGGGRGVQGTTVFPRAGQGLQPDQSGRSEGHGNDGYETSSSRGTGGGGAGTAGATYNGGAGILVSNVFPLAIFDNGYVGGGGAGTASGNGSYAGGSGGGGDSNGSGAGEDGMANTGGGAGGGWEPSKPAARADPAWSLFATNIGPEPSFRCSKKMPDNVQRVLDAAAADPKLDEAAYVRDLAALVRQCAEAPRMARITARWADVNELRQPDRAPVWCRPAGCWKELLPEESLLCRDPLHRGMESKFRQDLIKDDIGDDDIIEDHWPVAPVIRVTPPNQWGVEIGRHTSSDEDGAWGYDPPLKSAGDFDRLAAPEYAYDAAATEAQRQACEAVLGEAMPVKIRIAPAFDLATVICNVYAQLRGLENLMTDTLVEPELAHRLARHITDARLRYLDVLEGAGLNATNCDQEMLCSDAFGPAPVDGRYALANCWCAGNSQEFDQVSPDGFREFLLAYQCEIFQRFGRVSYGCCENLTHKMDMILADVPNLRLLTSSAWTDLGRVIDLVGDRYAIMWRHKATDVCFAASMDDLRPSLEADFQHLRGSFYQVVLRELQTLDGDLHRLHDWTQTCIGLAEEYAGGR